MHIWLLVEPKWNFQKFEWWQNYRILQNMQALLRRSRVFLKKIETSSCQEIRKQEVFLFPKFSNWHLPNWAYLFMEEVCNSATKWIGWKLKDKTARNGIFTLFQKTTKSLKGLWIPSKKTIRFFFNHFFRGTRINIKNLNFFVKIPCKLFIDYWKLHW